MTNPNSQFENAGGFTGNEVQKQLLPVSRLRNTCMLNISVHKLNELYLKRKFSCRKIGRVLDCSKGAVLRLLKSHDIPIRTKSEEGKLIKHPIKFVISKEKLKELYWKRNMSTSDISKKYGCSPPCIFRKMKKFGLPLRSLQDSLKIVIPKRSRSIAKSATKYQKNDFDGSKADKAYLIGFRLGDLHVSKNKFGQTIYVGSSSTKNVQLDLIKRLFSKYGHFNMSKIQKNCFGITFYLNGSFDFLLKKEDNIEGWILKSKKYFLSFLGGYIDAEGHFGVHKGVAEFSIATFDKKILHQVSDKLNFLGISCAGPKITVHKGYIDKRGVPCNNDLWRFRLTRKKQILQFTHLILPFLKHGKRLGDLEKVEQNVLERNIIS